tara:strand:- start:459 stop:632 length:174 start_codon:yes stop_codon:yes gene_type:complete
MDKETLIRLAQPAATTLLALSIISIPVQIKAYGDKVEIDGTVYVKQFKNDIWDVDEY